MSETGSEARSGIGVRLRAGREKMGLTQLQVAEKLHVDARVVESLESERYEVLGAAVFVRGHLKRYAELIGEQGAQLLELHSGATKAAMPDLTRMPKGAPDSSPSRLAVPALVVLIGFVLVGVVWWIAKSVGGPDATKPKHGQAVVIAPEVTPDAATTELPPAVGAPLATNSRAPAAGQNAGAASATSNTGTRTAAAAGASSGAAPAGAGAATGAASPAATRGKPMEVTLRFAADSWVEVYDANGQKLFYDVGSAASSHTVSGTPPLRVTVANAPGVSLDVNGKPATVPANAVKGDEAQFVINRSGRIVRAPPKADGG